MRNFILILAMAIFSTGTAQEKNSNKSEETVETKTTVETKEGRKTIVKKDKIRARQDIELENANEKKVNYKVKRKPFEIERETTFMSGSDNYNFTPDERGFRVTKQNQGNQKMMPYGQARRMTTDGYYIMTTNNNKTTAFGRFDQEGNFVIETYDPKTDKVVQETFRRETSKK